MPGRRFKEGMVVWAKVADRSGVEKSEPRPLVITSVHPKNTSAPFVAYCISTRPKGETPEPIFEMPWDPDTGGRTGLYRWCAVVLRWQVLVDPKDVEDVSGSVSAEMLRDILDSIEQARWIR